MVVVAAALLLLPLALVVGFLLFVGVPTDQGAQLTRLATARYLLPTFNHVVAVAPLPATLFLLQIYLLLLFSCAALDAETASIGRGFNYRVSCAVVRSRPSCRSQGWRSHAACVGGAPEKECGTHAAHIAPACTK